MGIVFKQTSWNIVTISIAILIGGVNTLYFYPEFLKDDYYGLVVFLLATSNLLQPLMSFGAQHTIIKFFSSFTASAHGPSKNILLHQDLLHYLKT